jgi:hypothetical protein
MHQQTEFVYNALFYSHPVQVPQLRCNVVTRTESPDQPRGPVLYPLQSTRLWKTGQNSITVTKATGDKGHNQSGGSLLAKNVPNGFQVMKMEVTHDSYLADVFP